MATTYSYRQASEEDIHLSTDDADVLNLLRDTSGNRKALVSGRPHAWWLQTLSPILYCAIASAPSTSVAGLPEGQQQDSAYNEASGAEASQVLRVHSCSYGYLSSISASEFTVRA